MLNFIINLVLLQLFIDLFGKIDIIYAMITQNEILSQIENDIVAIRGFL